MLIFKFKDELKSTQSKNVILVVNPAIFQFLSHIEFNSILELEKQFGH